MRFYNFIGCIFLLASLVSCGSRTNVDTNVAESETDLSHTDQPLQTDTDSLLINSVYEKFVFAGSDGNDNPSDYFTSNALKKLQDDYEFDCEDGPCYAFYALRTDEQDSKPGVEDVSQICSIESVGDGYYIVSYLDMGWSGMTRVKIVDGKIDDYVRCVSDL